MSQVLKIAIIGDYNFTYNSHQATNLAIDHAARFLELDINYYWIKTNEAAQFKPTTFEEFDGIWVAPGPYSNPFFLTGIIRSLTEMKIPVLLTGECLRFFVEGLINAYHLNPYGEKLISDNLIEGQQFERISIVPHSKAFIQLYSHHSTIELSSARYSLYPQLIHSLTDEILDIEAYNHFEEPEILSLKQHNFFVACSFSPQISSTRDIPHPLIYTFIKSTTLSTQSLPSN